MKIINIIQIKAFQINNKAMNLIIIIIKRFIKIQIQKKMIKMIFHNRFLQLNKMNKIIKFNLN